MDLETFLSELADERRTIRVYAEEAQPALAEHFANWNVEIQYRELPAGTTETFVTVHHDDEFLGGLGLDSLPFLRESDLTHPGTREREESSFGTFLDLLDNTLFRAGERRSLLATSREFEDRAWRVGEGTLHAAFQRPDAFLAQRPVYERLAETELDVHLYAATEWNVSTPDGTTTHADEGELGQFWVVAYEDTHDGEQDCLLLAEERDSDSYAGFWTYDPDRVERVGSHLRSTYW
jgi:DICT domain-containing protein